MSLDDVCWNISSVFIVITLGVIAILCVLTLLGVFVCIFDHDDKNDKSSKEYSTRANGRAYGRSDGFPAGRMRERSGC